MSAIVMHALEINVLKCRDVSDLATEYDEGAIGLRRTLAVRMHLLICRSCRNFLDQMSKTKSFLRYRPLDAPPPDVEASILASRSSSDRGSSG